MPSEKTSLDDFLRSVSGQGLVPSLLENLKSSFKAGPPSMTRGEAIDIGLGFAGGGITKGIEQITFAAIRVKGRTFTGFSHSEAFEKAVKTLKLSRNKVLDLTKDTNGFMTTEGRFVGRLEASMIAKKAGQVRSPPLVPERSPTGRIAQDIEMGESFIPTLK